MDIQGNRLIVGAPGISTFSGQFGKAYGSNVRGQAGSSRCAGARSMLPRRTSGG
ncbi:MAG: hypothetical protein IID42_06775 [Planctomycetes bacterium]|nr:hypothetical protein [Planctomycetota bacterium]